MSIHRRAVPSFCALLLLTAAGVGVGGSCATPPRPDPGAEEAIQQATGNAVLFEVEGGPLDAGPSAAKLTLADAVKRAIQTDPALQAALARVRIAMADADQARLLPNPVLSVALRWGPGKPQIEASLAQEFIQALQLPHRAGAADNRLRQAAADALTVALDTVAQVQERYVAIQISERLLPILQERLALFARLTAVANDRLNAGEGIQSEVTTLNAQRVELEVEIADTRLQQREDRLRLARMIGEPSGAAAWTLDPWTTPPTTPGSEEQWINAGLLHRPEVQSVAWRLAALGDDEALARLPWQNASVGLEAEREDDWFAGPSVSTPLPIFDSGQAVKARVAAEQIEARHDLTLARRKVVEDVRVAYQALAGSAANLHRVNDELLPLQQQRRQQAEESYRAGHTDVTALYLAEQDLRAAEAKAVDIAHRASLAQLRLQRAVGGPSAAASVSSSPSQPAPAQPVHTQQQGSRP